MNIRTSTNQDRRSSERVHLGAFPEGEREIVSKLAIDLLSEKTTPQTMQQSFASPLCWTRHYGDQPRKYEAAQLAEAQKEIYEQRNRDTGTVLRRHQS